MSNEQSPIFFPQAFLIWKQAYASAQSELKESKLTQAQVQSAKVVKLKGNYQPETVVSRFVTSDGVTLNNRLLNLENHKISALVPEVRLFRVVEKESGKNRVVPFYFPVASEYDFRPDGRLNLEKSSFSAGAAAIQRFEISLNGKNPYQVSRKFLEGSLTIKVDNISVLFDRKEGYAMLADLFTIRAGAKASEVVGMRKSIDPTRIEPGQSCRVVATLGYSVPRNYEMFDQEEIIMIEQSKSMINLYYQGHDLQLSQDGSCVVNIKYSGYLQAMKEQSNFDLFTNSKTKAWQNRRATKSKEVAGNINSVFTQNTKKSKKSKKPDKDAETKKTRKHIKDGFKGIIDDLYNNQKIHRTIFQKNYFEAVPVTPDESITKKAEKRSSKPEDPFDIMKDHSINYFNFGDLLESYFKKIRKDLQESITINKKKKEEKGFLKESDDHLDQAISRAKRSLEDLSEITVLLCDIKVTRNKEEDDAMIFVKNIADIPISIDNFYTKVWNQITKPGVAFYDMNSFLENFCLPLLNESLDKLPAAELVEDVHYKITTFTSRELRKRINRGIIDIDDVPKSSQAFTKKSIQSSSEYIVISQHPGQNSRSPGSGNSKSDSKKGIFHLRPNKDRGLLKNVTFSRISLPGREASLVVGNGNLYDELRLPHNATANMFGNFLFMPGSQVFVDPNTLGFGSVKDKNSAARRLGFGGYYTVESVKTTFTNGQLDTVLSLLFNAFPETDDEPSLSKAASQSIKEMINMMGDNQP